MNRKNKLLIISSSQDPTVQYMFPKMDKFKINYSLWDPGTLPSMSKAGISISNNGFSEISGSLISPDGENIDINKIGLIWYRRPGQIHAPGTTPNEGLAQFINEETNWFIKSFFMHIQVPIICDPFKGNLASIRSVQLKTASELGFTIPKTYIGNNPEEIRDFFFRNGPEIIVKSIYRPFAVNSNNEERGLLTTPINPQDLESDLALSSCPSIYQERINKKIEIRVTILKDKVFAAEIHSQESKLSINDYRNYDFDNTPYFKHQLPEEIEQKCIKMLEVLNLYYGALDLILNEKDEYIFLEINPFGQWAWIQELTGLNIGEGHCELFRDMLN